MARQSQQHATGCGCDDPSRTSKLISIESALQEISHSVRPIPRTECADIDTCQGRVLAGPVLAQADMPRFDHAAMDGYAVNSAALAGEGPWLLPVNGRVAAGDESGTPCAPTEACRIFTGAPLPSQFDAVVMQEEAENLGHLIRLNRRPASGEHVRCKGEQHRRGAEILPSGTLLTSRAIAACAAAGLGTVTLRNRVRVILIATGSEVAAPGAKNLRPGQIWDVNTPMLKSLLARADVHLLDIVRVDDNQDRIRCAIQSASESADFVLTTGGVSVGDEDHLHAAVEAAGGEILFAGVAIKPGKPVALGKIGTATWLGLPGNPGSAFVTWTIFGRAVLGALTGRADPEPRRRQVVLAHALSRKTGRCELRAASVTGSDGYGRDVVECASSGNSGQVSHFAMSDGLAFLPSEIDHLPKDALIEFLPFCTD